MIKRELFNELKAHLVQKEMTFIVGPRQAGKTTLMFLLKDDLEKNGQKTVVLNLDIEADRQHFTTQENLINKIRLEIGAKGYVFLDEIQRKENAGLFLKGIYDMNLPYKFIVSGSGSVELKEQIHESLAGRKRIFELHTVSFREFINFRTEYRYENKLHDFLKIEKNRRKTLLDEYMNFGGYPRVVLAETESEKLKIIEEIYQSYVERDIFNLLGIQKEEAFTKLVKVLASQIGNLINVSELSNTVGVARKTIEQYVWYLEKTFVIGKVTPFYKNIRKEITKSPKVYFTDLGLRNYSIGEFGRGVSSRDAGFLFENFVFLMLADTIKNQNAKIQFWRTKDGSEADFIIISENKAIPIEIKFSSLLDASIGRPLKNFIEKYRPERAYVVNLDLDSETVHFGTNVFFLPFYKVLNLKL
ncbi:ATPase [Candidatus Giovannonibacteria bacterium RIFCSPHIGHO2_02_43_13]|uniref:ATPase n=1 Tax=Candidatus Giovannonibacteria bacterium RIFCSPHIGHO2_02_43_13 TaxID=1798330 RepID=A0A1F5WSP8_9BACT|nr:MAG: hypothetical protein UW28_C0003G0001 [Parcubacteria group bacterium GW2011_GWA2_44_13]OGF73134.1 MAG: ATPase [Candidatus Giovannonibacteria bacterium RIFCSPHIGHO2_12_FULL_44_42]OGF78679.1 MAG: ATPase [Candidatus Giovannonibacteria bacterium RIFCSPHIGHO2_02_43_13]OGF89001.1 MAG: ATPase [Candidatus Giovannonibacteria bacterium RIFCSPLOWO2_02_FULL_43_54]OGF97437.1 MAG: ATPase [Candidatus Giovannonibacteria bacterium RIFCSPLOWO2_12_FULL_44_32]